MYGNGNPSSPRMMRSSDEAAANSSPPSLVSLSLVEDPSFSGPKPMLTHREEDEEEEDVDDDDVHGLYGNAG